MRLAGREYGILEEALLDSFVGYDELASALRRGTGWQIREIAAPGPMPGVVQRTIEYAESRDRVDQLVGAAVAANPSNVSLLTLSASLGLLPAGTKLDAVAPNEAFTAVAAGLERMVDPARGIADLGSFSVKLQELVRQVCAVEIGQHSGTGFLIGPRTVLTNYHVVQDAIEGRVDPVNIALRFDYQRMRDGRTTNAGTVFGVHDDWLIHGERYSKVDEGPYRPTPVPADNELDYAVLRTRDLVGHSTVTSGAERGWISPRAVAYRFPADAFLMVVQHPCDDPIAFDFAHDAVMRINGNGTRVHYRINTMPGSSGSPVLDRELELVGLHHAGEPGSKDWMLPCREQLSRSAYNEGIPISRIEQHLASKGYGWVFGSEGP